MYRKLNAFSSVEIFIVSIICFIIAAISITGLIKFSQKNEAVGQLEKTYASLNNAFNIAKMDVGTPEAWVSAKEPPEETYFRVFQKYLSMTKDTVPQKLSGIAYYGIDGNIEEFADRNSVVLGRLNDGILLRFISVDPHCNANQGHSAALKSVCGEVYVQVKNINGNVNLDNSIFGKNTFALLFTKEGFVPLGSKDSRSDASFLCRKKSDTKISSKSCTAWVLIRKNFDFLSKDNISW
jgi:hypothetical protein